jgi:hypothetical protein
MTLPYKRPFPSIAPSSARNGGLSCWTVRFNQSTAQSLVAFYGRFAARSGTQKSYWKIQSLKFQSTGKGGSTAALFLFS